MKRARGTEEPKEEEGKPLAPWLFLCMDNPWEHSSYFLARPQTPEGSEILTKVGNLIYSPEYKGDMTFLLNYLIDPKDGIEEFNKAQRVLAQPDAPKSIRSTSRTFIRHHTRSVPDWLLAYTPADLERHLDGWERFAGDDYPRIEEPVMFRSFATE